jgi:hypothetical protein
MKGNIGTYTFKSDAPGGHTITITCHADNPVYDASRKVVVNVTDSGYVIEPVEGAVVDFNPALWLTSSPTPIVDENGAQTGWRAWGDGEHSLTTSNNFDWVNGGFRRELDSDGNYIDGTEHFCIKAGTFADLDYKFFTGEKYTDEAGNHIIDNSKKTGKDFKVVFKTQNVKRSDAQILNCVDNTDDKKIGLEMLVHEALIHAETETLDLPYSEEDIIEFGF